MNAEDARRLGIEEHGRVRLTIGNAIVDLAATLRVDFPTGALGVPVGLPGLPPFGSATTCSIGQGG